MKTKKIGELNFENFKTEFRITPKVKKFFEKEKISLASLIPDAWLWYEVQLFETLDENNDGIPDKKFGKSFVVVYYGITEIINSKNIRLKNEEFEDSIKNFESKTIEFNNKKRSNTTETKKFNLKYIIIKK